MADTSDAAAELERALARRVHLLAAGLIGLSSLIYLVWLLPRAAQPTALALASMAALGLGTALLSVAWARRTQRHAAAVAGMCWLVFLAMAALVAAQGGVTGTAVWWLPLGPLLALQAGALRSGVAMAVIMLIELVVLDALRSQGWMAEPLVAPLGDAQRFIAVTSSSACMLIVVALGLHWRRRLLDELQAALATAHAASEVKTRFVANMSHEIRTPLNGIVGAAELLRGTRLDEGQRQVVGVLRRSSVVLMALVNDVLDLSKLEAGRMRTEQVEFDLHDAIHDAAEVFSAQAQAKGVELLSHCTGDLPARAVGDAARLRQIVHNLVANAVKFTDAGEVRVFAAPEPGPGGRPWMRISVRDTGIGMTEAQRATLFEAFTQADLSTTRRFGGSGLGLAICRELAALLGGRIEVESLPGRGSTFMVMLPLVAPPPVTVDASVPAPVPPLAGVTVQIVSPNRSQREDLLDVLQRAGALCSSGATWPADAVPGAPGAPADAPQLVLCDEAALASAGLDTAAWAEQLKASGRRGVLLAGLAVSARSLPRAVLPLYKPALPTRVLDTLRRALEPPPEDSARMELDPLAPPADSGAAQRVLLVEDNPVNQLVAQGLLDRLGASTVIAADGEQALRLFADAAISTRFDLVLMDCQMPELDGMACTRRLRTLEAENAWPRTPVIAMTAHSESEAGPACRAAGMDDFLPKPVELRQMAQVLARWRTDGS
jgi:signal transduction histidine kinase/ActR/RegA family two-component response regulator